MKTRGVSIDSMRALISAHQGRYRQAVHYFQSANKENNALEMFVDLKMFDQAQVKILVKLKNNFFIGIFREHIKRHTASIIA